MKASSAGLGPRILGVEKWVARKGVGSVRGGIRPDKELLSSEVDGFKVGFEESEVVIPTWQKTKNVENGAGSCMAFVDPLDLEIGLRDNVD